MLSREQAASEDMLAHARVTYAEELCGLTCSNQSILHVYLNGREKLPCALGTRGVQRRRRKLAAVIKIRLNHKLKRLCGHVHGIVEVILSVWHSGRSGNQTLYPPSSFFSKHPG